ncbi:MAG: proton-conducting transporter membrane subunit [Bryobacteraceae bacterium]
MPDPVQNFFARNLFLRDLLAWAAVLVPLLAAWAVRRARRARWTAFAGASISFACALLMHSGTAPIPGIFGVDALGWLPMVLFAALTMLTIVAAPVRDASPKALAGMLVILAGTSTVYSAGHLAVCALGHAATLLPFLAGWFEEDVPRPAKAVMLTGLGSVAAAAALVELGGPPQAAFALLMLAVLTSKGALPFHFWIPAAFEQGPLLPLSLLANGHIGALFVARFGVALFPEQSKVALTAVSAVALVTALATALLAVSERSPRRILALLSVSQASFILAGLESESPEGITGAAVHWLVVATAVMGLAIVYRLVEVRCPSVAWPEGYLGLAGRMPRLAAFFAVCGLTLVGLPGTLGFVAEDLLFHGAIESHAKLGLALPLATAINAITFLRLFATIFLGQRVASLPHLPDARRRERWALSVCVALLVLGGLFPQVAVSARRGVSKAIAGAASGEDASR